MPGRSSARWPPASCRCGTRCGASGSRTGPTPRRSRPTPPRGCSWSSSRGPRTRDRGGASPGRRSGLRAGAGSSASPATIRGARRRRCSRPQGRAAVDGQPVAGCAGPPGCRGSPGRACALTTRAGAGKRAALWGLARLPGARGFRRDGAGRRRAQSQRSRRHRSCCARARPAPRDRCRSAALLGLSRAHSCGGPALDIAAHGAPRASSSIAPRAPTGRCGPARCCSSSCPCRSTPCRGRPTTRWRRARTLRVDHCRRSTSVCRRWSARSPRRPRVGRRRTAAAIAVATLLLLALALGRHAPVHSAAEHCCRHCRPCASGQDDAGSDARLSRCWRPWAPGVRDNRQRGSLRRRALVALAPALAVAVALALAPLPAARSPGRSRFPARRGWAPLLALVGAAQRVRVAAAGLPPAPWYSALCAVSGPAPTAVSTRWRRPTCCGSARRRSNR